FRYTYVEISASFLIFNLQLLSTPDLQILDYGVGLPGSQHDATAWAETRLPQEHERLLQDGEWVWSDSAYPLQKWCQAPYKVSVHILLQFILLFIFVQS